MKIENSIKAIPGVPVSENATHSQKSGQRAGEIATADNAGAPSGTVHLSKEAQSIEKNLANDEVFDAARVAEIKRAGKDAAKRLALKAHVLLDLEQPRLDQAHDQCHHKVTGQPRGR